ncbi:MAG TPA: hypothetical protein VLB84_20755 [Bacteroidia bacterium]|nr:hypothetical protein [Bacteroidia bacterium]
MKKALLLLALSAGLINTGCNDTPKQNDVATVKPGMMDLNLMVNGNSLNITVPDSTIGKLEIAEQSWGATEIKVGKHFQISISEGQGDVALKKSDIAGDEINKFKRYIKEEPNTLFWESEITEPEFHFYTVEKVGPVFYLIENIKEDHFTEKDIQQMLESAQSLKLPEVKPAS